MITSQFHFPVLAVGVASLILGCATADSRVVNWNEQVLDANSTQPERVVCTVEIREKNARPDIRTIDITDGKLVKDALEETGVTRRFRRLQINLLRSTPEGKRAKMEVPYANGVAETHNYALREGDHLVVIEDASPILDDMIGSTVGPLSRLMGL